MVIPANLKLFGIIDKSGRLVHAPEIEDANEFHEGLAKACLNQKCGYVDTTGAWVIRPSFDYAQDFWHGLARVAWHNGEYGYVDKSGKPIWKRSSKALEQTPVICPTSQTSPAPPPTLPQP
jgi:hypothetical protein